MEYHKEFTYLLNDFELRTHGAVESIPGVPPSAGEILKVAQKIKKDQVRMILAAPTSNERVLKKLSSLSEVRYLITSPLLIAGESYPEHIKVLVKKMVQKLE